MSIKPQTPTNRAQLVEMMLSGFRPKFLFFWGHRIPANGNITKSCFSQWYPAAFEIGGIHYPTAEHFMMAEKARLFNDPVMEEKILTTKNPALAKKYGRLVEGYNDQTWKQHCFDTVARGNIAKFSQNNDLGNFLKKTGTRVIVEASPVDQVWGIGLDEKSKFAGKPDQWRGLNLLGFVLMQVRNKL